MYFPDFQDQRVKIYKNHKIENCLFGMFSSKVIKKIQNFQKSGNFVFLDDFRVRQARGLGINNFFDIVYLRAGDAAKTGNIHDFSWDDHRILLGRTWKNTFLFFSLLKFVTRYCSNSSDEKTLKFNKKHQLHRLSKQSRVFKKDENPWKTSNIEKNI